MVSFVEDGHKYLKDNLVIIPSVSELVKYATGENYWGIPRFVLEKAASFGTDIHNAIERLLIDGEDTEFLLPNYQNAFNEFKRLKDEHIKGELKIETMLDYDERYAGRCDLIADDILIDYKTNTSFDEKLQTHLEWQMGFYKLALESKGIKISKCFALWLPKKGSGKWLEISPVESEKLLKVLEDYEKDKTLQSA